MEFNLAFKVLNSSERNVFVGNMTHVNRYRSTNVSGQPTACTIKTV